MIAAMVALYPGMNDGYGGYPSAALAPGGVRTSTPGSRAAFLALGYVLPVASFILSWRVLRLTQANLTLSDALLMAAVAILVVAARLETMPFGRLSGAWITGLSLMLGGLLASSLYHSDTTRWLIVAAQYIFAMLLVPMVLASVSSGLLRRCVLAYVYGVAASQAISLAIAPFFAETEWLHWLGPGFHTGNGRLGALTGEPNPNGAVCAYALVMLLHAMLARWLRLAVAIPVAILIGWGLLASASVTGFAATVLACVVFLGFSHPRNLAKVGIPFAAALAIYIAAGGPIPETFQERVFDAMASGDPDKAGTFIGRSALIREAWAMADDNLLLGLGPDRYRVESIYGAPVHNIHLLMLNEGGLVCAIGLWTLFGTMIAAGFAVLGRVRLDGAACLGVTTAFMVYAMAIPHMYTRIWAGPPLLFLLWAIVHLAEAPSPGQHHYQEHAGEDG